MITKDMLRKLAPSAKEEIIAHLADNLNDQLAKYNINTYLRVCHFLAQAAHESASFRTLEEYATGAAYEGRKDLGNTQPGDGRRYKGRGIFQLTGRANYRTYGQKLGYDLENNPELAKDPLVSIKTACEYWNSRGLSAFADNDDVMTVTKRINGGFNGINDRKQYLVKAKAIIPKDLKLSTYESSELPPAPVDLLIPPIVVAKRGDKSSYVKDLQDMLVRKGAAIVADGDFGAKTEQAVKDFQTKNKLPATGAIDTDTLNRMMI
jgi:putative chitinase